MADRIAATVLKLALAMQTDLTLDQHSLSGLSQLVSHVIATLRPVIALTVATITELSR